MFNIVNGDINAVPFFDEVTLANYVGVSTSTIRSTALNANTLYSTFYINKDTGKICHYSEGIRLRRIDAPRPTLKAIQVALCDLLKMLPYDPANYGFINGKSILDAAQAVADGSVLVHADIKDFFPSHTAVTVYRKLEELLNASFPGLFKKEFIKTMVQLMCLNNRLPQGSPCSPVLTVILNADLDKRVTALADKYGLKYARYVDDLTFAGEASNLDCTHLLEELAEVVHPHRLNYKKSGIMRTSSKPVCRGIKISSDTFMMSSMQAAVINLCKKYLNVSKVDSSNYKITIESKDILVEDLNTAIEAISNELALKYRKFNFTVKRWFFYVQSTKTVLGLHVDDGKVNFPRKTYEELRLTAMLVGIQRALFYMHHVAIDIDCKALGMLVEMASYHNNTETKRTRNMLRNPINRKTFNGKVSYIRSVDPTKGASLKAIEDKAFKRMIKTLVERAAKFRDINQIKAIVRRYL